MKNKRKNTSPEVIEVVAELLFILTGAACLIIGLALGSTPLIIVGIILLLIGGVCVLIFHGDSDGGGSSGGGSFSGGSGGGSSFLSIFD